MFHLALLVFVPAKIDLTFVRHGETVANATGLYSNKTLNAFSDKGKKQVASLTDRLRAEKPYDLIFVSPAERTLRTIAPYLRATRRRAIVWPLLYECCTMKRPVDAHATTFKYVGKVKIPRDLQGLFTVYSNQSLLPDAPDYNSGLAQVQQELKGLKGQAGKRILLVGHAGNGGQILHALTGKWIKVDNGQDYHYNVQP